MKRRNVSISKTVLWRTGWALTVLLVFPGSVFCEPTPSAVASFDSYIQALEKRLDRQHHSSDGIAAVDEADARRRLRRGESIIEQLTPDSGEELSRALLHHWRGTAFVAGAKASDVERLLRDFESYPHHYRPEVLRGKVLSGQGDNLVGLMRVRQHHVLTVVMDTTYDVSFGRLDAHHGFSASRSTQIHEIESPGSGSERAQSAKEEHGFLWRLNNYWSYAEADGGLYLQIESVSLTRDIPHGLGWAVRPFIRSIPRESLEFTLNSTEKALAEQHEKQGEKP